MKNKKYISSLFTWKFLYFVAFVHLIDIAMGGQLTAYFQLTPNSFLNDAEYWRIISYPFAQGNIASLLLFFLTLTFFGPKVELNLEIINYAILLIFTTLLAGALNCLFFFFSDFSFQGMDVVSFFTMAIFLFLNPRIKIQLFNITQISGYLLASIFVLIWFGTNILEGFQFENYALLSLVSSPLIATSLAGLIALVLRLRLPLIHKSNLQLLNEELLKEENRNQQNEEDNLDLALITNQIRKNAEKKFDETLQLTTDPKVNEDRMNQILDKIIEKGKDSLSTSEKNFMKEYSEKL